MAAMNLTPSHDAANLADCLGQLALWRGLPATDLRQISERLHSKVIPPTCC